MSRTVGFSCATDPHMLMVDATGQVDELKTSIIGIIIGVGLTQIRGQVKKIWSNQYRLMAIPRIS